MFASDRMRKRAPEALYMVTHKAPIADIRPSATYFLDYSKTAAAARLP